MADFFYNAKRHRTFSIQRFLYHDCAGHCLQLFNGLVLLHSVTYGKSFITISYLNGFISADCCFTFIMFDSPSQGLVHQLDDADKNLAVYTSN